MSALARISLALAVSIAASTTRVSAWEPAKVYGAGSVSCGAWTDERHHAPLLANDDLQWILGYISANNVWGKENIAEGTDAEGMAAWVDNYCAAHPLDSLAVATEEMIQAMLDAQVQEILKHPPRK